MLGNQRTLAAMAWSVKGKLMRHERLLAEMDQLRG
jgi:hypothetical protein